VTMMLSLGPVNGRTSLVEYDRGGKTKVCDGRKVALRRKLWK
jgi:hypothetical protein